LVASIKLGGRGEGMKGKRKIRKRPRGFSLFFSCTSIHLLELKLQNKVGMPLSPDSFRLLSIHLLYETWEKSLIF
jgi:hypothetical protein